MKPKEVFSRSNPKGAALGFLLLLCPFAALAQDRTNWRDETFLHTTDAVALCLRRDQPWVDFCNGLMQGYADFAVVSGKACPPMGTTRRQLVEVFTSPEVVVTTGYIDDRAAFETALQLFIKYFPCAD